VCVGKEFDAYNFFFINGKVVKSIKLYPASTQCKTPITNPLLRALLCLENKTPQFVPLHPSLIVPCGRPIYGNFNIKPMGKG
jgi:hypothetical protein